MAKHTQGPWTVETPMGDETPWIVEAGKASYEWRTIAIVPMPEDGEADEIPAPEARANLRLMIAAPDLLKALQEIADGLGNTGSDPDQWMTRIKKSDAWSIAVNAIAKAA